MSDCSEHALGTDPVNIDTDGDGVLDGAEVLDYGADPKNSDTDYDELNDDDELFVYRTEPKNPDTDFGGVDDGTEIAVGTNPHDPDDDDPQNVIGKYVAMGDSFQSGEGADTNGRFVYYVGTDEYAHPAKNLCHRSPKAYGPRLRPALGYASFGEFSFAACSGAVIDNLRSGQWNEGPQLDHLNATTELVTIGIGGNDMEFANILNSCITQGLKRRAAGDAQYLVKMCAEIWEPKLNGMLSNLYNDLVPLYDDIRARAPEARVVVVGYPKFFQTDGWFKPTCKNIAHADQQWVNGAIIRTNAVIAQAVANANVGFEFVDIYDVPDGNELCSSGFGKEFLNGIVLDYFEGNDKNIANESFHPTGFGHRLIADRLLQYLGTAAQGTSTSFAMASSEPTMTAASLTLNSPPQADIQQSVDGTTVTLDASSSSDPDGSIVRHLWDLGDGTVQAGSSITHTYTEGGWFVPTLSVRDNEGAVTTATATAVPGPTGAPNRIGGDDRYATATLVSREYVADGAASAVVLARGGNFPDALAGTPLAAQKGGPLLLTDTRGIPPVVSTEIQRVLPPGGVVYLLGGTAAISDNVAVEVKAMGFTVVRYGGQNRYDTAKIIAEQGLGSPKTVLLATGANFPDALVAGVAAAKASGAVLLTAGSQMSTETTTYLDTHQPSSLYALGGQAAAAAPSAVKLAGADRYVTAKAVADHFYTTPTDMGVASGQNFPDALGGGAHIAAFDGPLLLTPPTSLSDATAEYLKTNPSIERPYLYGGTAAIADDVKTAIRSITMT